MKVNVMELLDETSPDGKKTLLQVDDETLITVLGLGSGDFRWKVENCNSSNESYVPMDILPRHFNDVSGDGYLDGCKSLGSALIWAEPITFAHVVMDLINNQ